MRKTLISIWCPEREDLLPLLLITLLPLVVSLPQFSGWLNANPMLYVGNMSTSLASGFLPGYPYIDPNGGFTTQALGYRAALDWLHGQLPWWNPYSGVGLPLAAEYQPAAFFPLTLLLLIPQGMVWQHLVMQLLAGWGTYALLRQLGVVRLAATMGGLLYAFNGTLAWLNHAPILPVPFLPWMLYGLERIRAKIELGLPGGWYLFAMALALSLLAGFPESAYINGLLALAWAMLRCVQTAPDRRSSFAGRITLAGAVGIALSAPQIWAFFAFLPHAWLGAHGGSFAQAALDPAAFIPSLLAPYAYGPIFTGMGKWQALSVIWGNIGGYISMSVLLLAVYGFFSHRVALSWLLLSWSALALAKTFGLRPVVDLWNMVPGIPSVAFFRYAPPSWELALVILATFGLDDLTQAGKIKHLPLLCTVLASMLAVSGGLLYGTFLWPHLRTSVGLELCAVTSALWVILTTMAILGLLWRTSPRRRSFALASLLVADSVLMFAVPTLSNPRGGTVDGGCQDSCRVSDRV